MKSFDPCRPLAQQLAPAVLAFWRRYLFDDSASMIGQVAAGRPFDRDVWRLLVGEILLHGADELPQIGGDIDALLCQIPLDGELSVSDRSKLGPIGQAICGSRDLLFGLTCYQPERTGWNDVADVGRLALVLKSAAAADSPIADHGSQDQQENADCARDAMSELAEMYERAMQKRQVVICDRIEPSPILSA